MKSGIIFVLVLLWACCTAAESVNNLRGRELRKELKIVCMNLNRPSYGNFGWQSVKITQHFARWATRSPQGAKWNSCRNEDPLPSSKDRNMKSYCRKFGGNKGELHTFNAPQFMGPWLEAHGCEVGACTGRNVGSTIKISSAGASPGDDDVFCMDFDDGEHTIEVSYPSELNNNWFRRQAEENGECTGGDDSKERNTNQREYCVEINGKWYDVDTYRFFHDWWDDNGKVDRFLNEPCDDANKSSEGTIEMKHYDDDDDDYYDDDDDDYDDDVDDGVLCMDIDGDLHTIEVFYPAELDNWFDKKAEEEGECTGGDDFKERNKKPADYCVEIKGKWYTVETFEFFEFWWEEETTDFYFESCDSNDITDEGTIEMSHY